MNERDNKIKRDVFNKVIEKMDENFKELDDVYGQNSDVEGNQRTFTEVWVEIRKNLKSSENEICGL